MDSFFQRLQNAPVQVYLLVLGALGYVAILVTGFGSGLGLQQPLILYVYLCLLLLLLQAMIIENHSVQHVLYAFFGSVFFLAYAALVVFYSQEQQFTRSIWFYLVINVVLFGIFLSDVIRRRRIYPQSALPNQDPIVAYLSGLAADFLSFAVLAAILNGAMSLLASPLLINGINNASVGQTVAPIVTSAPHISGQSPCLGYACNDLQHELGISFGTIHTLGFMNLVLALLGAVAFLLLFGLIGVVVIGNQRARDAAFALPEGTTTTNPTMRFLLILRQLLAGGLAEAMQSLRSTLGALIWLVPAFIMAFFVQNFAHYLNAAAGCFGSGCQGQSLGSLAITLLNPAAGGVADSLTAIGFLLLGAIAVAAVLTAVAVNELNVKVIQHALDVFSIAGQTVAVTLTFFFFSLMALNAVVYLIGNTQVLPFQIGAAGFLMLLVAIGFSVAAVVRHRMKQRAATPVAP